MSIIKLTKTAVDSLPYTQNGQTLYFDTELTGFGVRVGRASKVYIAESRLRGKTTRVKIGRHGRLTAEEARSKAKIILGRLEQGLNP
ncbi:MAG TPA: Arm DNA-binding domain-containing protein, partial [Burkholderiales bacterium]|nr:Arm DNA-binding domain-containing protein [Burkholderiales bacterium]